MRGALIVVSLVAIPIALIAWGFGSFDSLYEKEPKVGEVWLPSFATNQPYWPNLWDTKVVEVRDGFVLTECFGNQKAYSLHGFHATYDYCRPK